MRILSLILLSLFVNVSLTTWSQRVRTEVSIDFGVNDTRIDRSFSDNDEQLESIMSLIRRMQADPKIEIYSIWFCGTASPEGSYQLNKRLAHERMAALESVVRSRIEIPESLIERDDAYIPWDRLITMVQADSDFPDKDEVIAILRGPSEIVTYNSGRTIDSRILELKKLQSGRVWQTMYTRYFAPLRNASVIIVTNRELTPRITRFDGVPAVIDCSVRTESISLLPVELSPYVEPTPEPEPVAVEWNRKAYLKTNFIEWGLLIANIEGEIDLDEHWSVALPFNYSAWNYFSQTVKFRTASIYPQVRYWMSPENDGWFVGAHIGIAHYNFAIGGTYRTQDTDGSHPAIGGGFDFGYRMPISADRRWKLEFAIGAGVYGLKHDRFRNYANGLLVYSEKKTYFGIDQASVSIAYTFDLKKKGGIK